MSTFTIIKEGTSPSFHFRIDEIERSVGPLDGYVVEFFESTIAMKRTFLRLIKDADGYINLSSCFATLSGDVNYHPYFNVDGDFAMVMVLTKRINPVNKKVDNLKTLLVFEKAFNPFESIGGEKFAFANV